MTLTPDQTRAAETALSVLTRQADHRQCVLAGYAGTGKTYTTQHIAQRLTEAGYRVAALSPTHRAGAVLAEALPPSVDVRTLHSALGMGKGRNGEFRQLGRAKLSGVDAILVDECSMVDDKIMQTLVASTSAAETPILWIGDPAQIPPVGLPASPVFGAVQTHVRLEKIVRQAEDNPIIAASMYLRDCLEAGRMPDPHEMWASLPADPDTIVMIPGNPQSLAEDAYGARAHGLDARALAYRNKTVDLLARLIHAQTHPPGTPRYTSGDPVVFGRAYEAEGSEAHNGAQGTVVANQGMSVHGSAGLQCHLVSVLLDDGRMVEGHAPDDPVTLATAINRLDRARQAAIKAGRGSEAVRAAEAIGQLEAEYMDLHHATASTSHKAQGSTWDVAVVDWRDMTRCGNPRLAARLLYVACTRPRKFLVIGA